jgi:hypothetical protein
MKSVVASVTKDESKLRSALVSNVLVKQGQQVPLLGFCIVPSESIQLRKGCEITSCGEGEKALRFRIPRDVLHLYLSFGPSLEP